MSKNKTTNDIARKIFVLIYISILGFYLSVRSKKSGLIIINSILRSMSIGYLNVLYTIQPRSQG